MISEKLVELGIQLPAAPEPVASYIPAKVHNGLIYTSGQLPLLEGKLLMTGQVTDDSEINRAKEAMRQCFLNALSAASSVVSIDSIQSVLKLTAFVNSSKDFHSQHLIANGASDIATLLFGDDGRHSRSAVGVSALPLNASVELEVIFVQ